MTVEVVLVVVLVLLCVSGLFMWIKLAGSNARTIEAPRGGDPDEIFRGGVMARYVITSGSLVRLEMYDWGVRLRGMLISRWVVPTWEARYEELASAELVALPASRNAVWLRLRDEPNAIAFLSEQNLLILPLLEKRGVPINRAVTKIRRVEELYQPR